MKLKRVGLDLAKRVFQVHGVDAGERAVVRKTLTRKRLRAFLSDLEPTVIGMEACGSAHYWARELSALGHEVRLISPQFVKPYVKGNKNVYEELQAADARVRALDAQLKAHGEADERVKRLQQLGGVGPVVASALVAGISDGRQFKSGRDLSAWLGIVPRQHGSGGKAGLGGISKRGDTYLRTLLIHGARAVVTASARKTDRRSTWINALVQRQI